MKMDMLKEIILIGIVIILLLIDFCGMVRINAEILTLEDEMADLAADINEIGATIDALETRVAALEKGAGE